MCESQDLRHKSSECSSALPDGSYKPGLARCQYRDRLITLNLLSLTYDRELKDLIFFYRCLLYHTHPDVHSFTNFISHGRTRPSNPLNLKAPICKTSTFQASYFNRIVKLWNYSCSIAPSSGFSSPLSFQLLVKQTLFDHLRTSFDIDWSCTWTLVKTCSYHKL